MKKIKLIDGLLRVIETDEEEPTLQNNNYQLNTEAYDKCLCPYCNYQFEKHLTRKRKCPECQNTILIKTHFETKKKMLLKEEQLDIYEKEASGHWNKHWENNWIENFFKKYGTTFEEEKGKYSSVYSNPYDIAWGMLNRSSGENAANMKWGEFRNIRMGMGDLLKREGKLEQSLLFYLEVCYLDINGATNTVNDPKLLKKFPPFQPQDGLLAPGIVHYVETLRRELNLSLKDIKDKFIDYNTRLYKDNSLVPLSAGKVWVALEKELLANNN